MKLHTKLLAGAALMALAAIPGKADATAYAFTALAVDNFTFDNAGGAGGFVGFSTFSFIEKVNTAQLNGATAANPLTLSSTTSGASLDQALVGVGNTGSFANNVYFPVPGIGAVAGNYAVADSNLLKTTVTGGQKGSFGSESGVQITGNGTANAVSATGNQLEWDFHTTTSAIVKASWTGKAFAQLVTTLANESASGTVQYRVQIKNNVTNQLVFDFNDSIGAIFSPTTVGTGEHDISGDTGNLALNGDTTYSLLVSFDSSANATSVPEPVTLALLGVGLLGTGIAARRRRQA